MCAAPALRLSSHALLCACVWCSVDRVEVIDDGGSVDGAAPAERSRASSVASAKSGGDQKGGAPSDGPVAADVAEATPRPARTRPRAVCARFLDMYVALFPDVIKNWMRFESYWKVLADVAQVPAATELLLSRELVWKSVDLFLQDDSPLADSDKKRARMGNQVTRPAFGSLLTLVATLLMRSETRAMRQGLVHLPASDYAQVIRGQPSSIAAAVRGTDGGNGEEAKADGGQGDDDVQAEDVVYRISDKDSKCVCTSRFFERALNNCPLAQAAVRTLGYFGRCLLLAVDVALTCSCVRFGFAALRVVFSCRVYVLCLPWGLALCSRRYALFLRGGRSTMRRSLSPSAVRSFALWRLRCQTTTPTS